MLSIYDYIVIGFYFLFMIGIGLFFRRFTKNSSEYFRGGGQMTWWLVGSSAFMASFSAWTFTGAASIAYKNGVVILVIYYANAFGFFLNYVAFAPWFRQLRVITVMEAVRARFSKGNEQFFTWMQLPIQVTYAGIWLFGLAVFVSSVFHLNLSLTIVLTGSVVLIMSAVGGAWAVVAGDFLQALILMPITVVAAFLALMKVGGWGRLSEQLPASHWDLSGSSFTEYGMFWVIAMVVKQIVVINNMHDASRYLCVKDGPTAKKAALLSTILFLVGPIIWFLPPLAARVLYPDLAGMFPSLKNPGEGAYVAIALQTMPAGLLGLLVTGIFATTMASMDSGLNRNAGIFIKSVYQPLFAPQATERQLVVAGKITTVVFGLLAILVAWDFSSWQNVGLFKLMINFSALVGMPYCVPLFWCLLIKKSPPWSGWSTVLVTLVASIIISNGLDWAIFQPLFQTLHLQQAVQWSKQHDFVAEMLVNVTVGSTWFLGTCIFYNRTSDVYKRRVTAFFRQMKTPVDFKHEIGEQTDHQQATALSTLCLIYAGFVLLLVLIPNDLLGRGCILFCSVCMGIVGCLLRWSRSLPVASVTAIATESDDSSEPAKTLGKTSPTTTETV